MTLTWLLAAGSSSPGVYYAYQNSDSVGKGIVIFLLVGSVLTWTVMLDKAMADIDWNKSADELHNLVRGLNPWPVAVMRFEGKRMKVFDVSVLSVQGTAGEAFVGPDRSFCVYCGKDALRLNVVQPENKKRMSGADFLLGHPLNDKNRNLL